MTDIGMIFAAFAGVAAGLIHVFSGPDHLAAVAPLASHQRRRTWSAGLRWGLGHTAGVLLVGLLLLAFRSVIPIDAISAYSERLVGLALLGVGVWGFHRASRPHDHRHDMVDGGASFVMGTLHGVAGSSHLFGILPAMAFSTRAAAVSYLGGFGIGAIAGMTVFAGIIGAVASRADRFNILTHRGLLYACSLSAFAVGGFWLVA